MRKTGKAECGENIFFVIITFLYVHLMFLSLFHSGELFQLPKPKPIAKFTR